MDTRLWMGFTTELAKLANVPLRAAPATGRALVARAPKVMSPVASASAAAKGKGFSGSKINPTTGGAVDTGIRTHVTSTPPVRTA